MEATRRAALVDAIYEAAVIPERWVTVLQDLADLSECHGTTLFAVDPSNNVRSLATRTIEPVMAVFARDGWMERNSRAARLAKREHPGFVTDLDLFTRDEMDRDPFYTEFLRPLGCGWGVGTLIPMPSGDTVVFNIERDHASGPVAPDRVTELDTLRPHLARASLLSVRLGLERARGMTAALAALGLPAAVLRANGAVLATNDLMESLMPGRLADRAERLFVNDAAGDRLLAASLSHAARHGPVAAGRSIPLAADGKSPPAVLHLIPLAGSAHDLFSQAAMLAVLTEVGHAIAPDVTLLKALFDLTPAESRLAALIATGLSPGEAAPKLGVSVQTTRTVLKRVFAKTGVSRQSELAALLSRLVVR